MCGIAGATGISVDSKTFDSVNRTVAALAHRGPDSQTTKQFNSCILGMSRLSILDHAGGIQPMSVNCKDNPQHMVFNGEIYNHQKLRKELQSLGHSFSSHHSDTEVILHAYEEWGEGAFAQLDGMFAFAIYDDLKRELVLVRDRFGEKPIYFGVIDDIFYFTSELRAIKLLTSTAKLKEQAVLSYLKYGFVNNNDSMIEGIRKLSSGSYMRIHSENPDNVRVFEYFNLNKSVPHGEPNQVSNKSASFEKRYRKFSRIFEDSVESRIEADCPVGLAMSGGLDSTAIAIAAKKRGRTLGGFMVGFEDPSFDETEKAKVTAQILGMPLRIENFNQNAFENSIRHITRLIDEPVADISCVVTEYLSTFASQEVKVILGGDGSDELQYGYRTYQILKYLKILESIPFTRKMNVKLPIQFPKFNRLISILNCDIGYEVSTAVSYSTPYLSSIIDKKFLSFGNLSSRSYSYTDFDLNEARLQYLRHYMSNIILRKVDISSMNHSLEYRSPFLGNDVSAILLDIDYRQHLNNGGAKSLLRRYVDENLPAFTIDYKKKGFDFPVGRFIANDSGKGIFDVLLHEDWGVDFINSRGIARILNSFSSGNHNLGALIWSLYVYKVWYLENLSR